MKISASTLKLLLIGVSLISFVTLFFFKPIPQDEDYHHFADVRTVFSIANCWNVVSNIFFLIVGIIAMQKLAANKLAWIKEIRPAYYLFFTGILLVALGSAFYHHNPNNTTLVWDRLPMTIAFMSLLSFALAEFVSFSAGRVGLVPFLVTGIFSIAWWQYGELHHNGDLRLYALVQFLPILILALLLLFGHPVYNTRWGYLALFGAYILAKLAEHFDAGIYNITGGVVAGHALKHIITAIGLWLFLIYLQKRKPAQMDPIGNAL